MKRYTVPIAVAAGMLTFVLAHRFWPTPAADSLTRRVLDHDVEGAARLIEHGADVNAPDEHGLTPLQHAALSGRVELVQLLLASGADPNVRTTGPLEQSPLVAAAGRGHIEVVRCLLDHGVDLDADGVGETALCGAAISGLAEIADLLVASGVEVRDPARMVRGLVVSRRPKALREFLDQLPASEVATAASHGLTAVPKPDLEVTRMLLDYGADPDTAMEGRGETALRLCAAMGALDTASLLLARGADVNVRDAGGRTALHASAQFGSVDMTELLLAHGADVDARDSAGSTPLHFCARAHRPATAKLLLEHGADVNARNDLGETPLAIVLTKHRPELADLLREHGGVE